MIQTPKIVLSVTTDLNTDQRVQKIATSLYQKGYQVRLIGRALKASEPIEKRAFQQERIKLGFEKGFLFYAFFNLRLFFKLFAVSTDLYYANDLDTLLPNYLVSKLKRKPLIYDSHEYFTEVPELVNRPRVQAFWRRIEAWILPNLKYAITVSQSIAKTYKELYGLDMILVRNFPLLTNTDFEATKKRQIIYQGALNVGRGLEQLIEAMQFVENARLLIAGTGDIAADLKEMRDRYDLKEKVLFLGRLKPEELRKRTQESMIGVSLEEDLGLNYRYALPNKVFDYLQAKTPILYADLVEVKNLLDGIEIGEELKSRKPEQLAEQISLMLDSSQQAQWQKNSAQLAAKYNWQNEEERLINLCNKALNG